MRSSVLVLLACVSWLLLLCPLSVSGVEESDVVVLTDANFDELTNTGSWMLEFYAPWCGHCKTLAPVYEDAARKLRGTLNLAKIDATVQTALAARYDIKGFPSIKFFREGEIRNYNGARTVDALVAFGKEMNAPAVAPLTQLADFQALTDKHPVSILFFGGKAGVERRLFDSLAYRLQGSVKFFSVEKSATEVYTAASIKPDETPIILLVTKNADLTDASNRYAGPWVQEELRSFILKNKLPLISELNSENFEDVTTCGKKILYAVVNTKNKQQSQDYVQSLYRVAKIPALREAFVFASIDGIKYNKYVSQFGVVVGEGGSDVSALPTVVVLDKELDYFYAPRAQGSGETQKIHPIGDAAKVEEFLNDIISGRIGLTGTTPWYNPSRYVKILEKSLSKLPVWQVAILAVLVMLSIVGCMFYACFYGLDGSDEQVIAAADVHSTQQANAAVVASKKKERTASADSQDDAASAKDDGLRARKPAKDQ